MGGHGLEKVKCGIGIAGVLGRAHPLSSRPAPPNFAPLDSRCSLAARTLGGAAWSDSGTRTRSANGSRASEALAHLRVRAFVWVPRFPSGRGRAPRAPLLQNPKGGDSAVG